MINTREILQTIKMIDQQHLDIRTITMGISLRDCARQDKNACCDAIYDKITRSAEHLVKTGEDIEREFGIPIVNKRISVTPIAIACEPCRTSDYAAVARTLDKAAVRFLLAGGDLILCGANHSYQQKILDGLHFRW